MKKCLLIVVITTLLGCATAKDMAAGIEAGGPPLFCALPQHSNVAYSDVLALAKAAPNEVLNYAEGPLQYGELWLPPLPHPKDKNPLVILIHGGCWLNAYDVTHTHALSTALAQSGYAVWAPEYRRVGDPGGGWPGSLQDVKAAIRYIREQPNAAVDLMRVVLVGHSAGGHLALLASGDQTLPVRAAIGLAAITDIEAYAMGNNSCQQAAGNFMRGLPVEQPAAYIQASLNNLRLPEKTMLLHGSADAIVPLAQAEVAGVAHKVVEGAGHFDFIHPGTAAYQSLLRALAEALQE